MQRDGRPMVAALTAAVVVVLAALGVLAAPQDVAVEIVAQADGTFRPSEFWVLPGRTVTVTFTNGDPFGSHNIVFELDAGRVLQVNPIGLGRSERLVFPAPAALGDYVYYSSVGNDRQRGMEGYLRVGVRPTDTPPGPTEPTATRTPTGAPSPTAGATAGPEPETVVADLRNPRGLTMGHDGTLLIAEGGSGSGPPDRFSPGNGDGRVLRLVVADPLQRETVVGDLTNVVWPAGGVMGANHALWWDRPAEATDTARVVLVAVAGGPNHARPDEAAKVLEIGPGGGTVLADPLAYEAAVNPDGGDVASDPRRLVHGLDPQAPPVVYVVDGGGNAVLAMDPLDGDLSTYAVFQPLGEEGEVEAAPGGMAVQPDNPSVSFVTLTAGGRPGLGQIRRLEDLDGDGAALGEGENELWVDGLDAPVDMAFSPAGPMAGWLVACEAGRGRLVLVSAQGLRPIEVAAPVPGCGGLAFEPNGDLLVSVSGLGAGGGAGAATQRVVRVPREGLAPPEPTPGTGTPPTAVPTATGTPGTPGATRTPGPSPTAAAPAGTLYLPVLQRP